MPTTTPSSLESPLPVRLLFVRHGSRRKDRHTEDRQSPLSQDGKKQATSTLDLLTKAEIPIGTCYSSQYKHAHETALILTDQGSVNTDLEVLTPHQSFTRHTLIDAIEKQPRSDLPTVFVGHEPRLSKLVAFLTGTRPRPMGPCEVVCVKAESVRALRLGLAKVAWRVPVRAHEEAELRPKVQSKLTVATFLAGFTFTALVAILTGGGLPDLGKLAEAGSLLGALSTATPFLAILLLTLAMVLFVAAVYAYDSLSMPEGFWIRDDRPTRWSAPRTRTELDEFGPVYMHMIGVWRRFFTLAVRLAAVGFLLFVCHAAHWAFAIFLFAAGVALWPWIAAFQPRLGID